MNIYLIGFMGVGKSTIAKRLNDELDYNLIDTDEEIEKNEGLTINDIFAKHGEEYFRELEANLINELSTQDNLIVSCGGGVIKNDENVRLMKESGRVILLEASPETLYDRLKDTSNRPLLEGRMSVEGISELLEERKPLYDNACTDRIRTDNSINQVIDFILRIC